MNQEGRIMFEFDKIEADLLGFKVPLPRFNSDAGFVEVQVSGAGLRAGLKDMVFGVQTMCSLRDFLYAVIRHNSVGYDMAWEDYVCDELMGRMS